MTPNYDILIKASTQAEETPKKDHLLNVQSSQNVLDLQAKEFHPSSILSSWSDQKMMEIKHKHLLMQCSPSKSLICYILLILSTGKMQNMVIPGEPGQSHSYTNDRVQQSSTHWLLQRSRNKTLQPGSNTQNHLKLYWSKLNQTNI